MMRILSLVLLLAKTTIQQDCVVDTSKFINPSFARSEPILLNPETSGFVYPSTENGAARYISVSEGTSILVSCGDSTFSSSSPGPQNAKAFVANCTNNADKQFEYSNHTLFKMEDVSCQGEMLDTVISTKTQTCAADKGTIIKVGYPVPLEIANAPLYEVCFDSQKKTVFYSHFTLTQIQTYRKEHHLRTYSTEDDKTFYNLKRSISDIYASRKLTINKLLGLPENSKKYFQSDFIPGTQPVKFDIAQEMLADYTQFFYNTQENAAARLFNTVPLWDIYRYPEHSNWFNIKSGIDRVASDNRIDLDVYAGTYGVATLPHEETDKEVELYLYQDGDTRAVPVPKLLWNLIYYPENKTAIVFVAVNNPFEVKDSDKICDDVSKKYGWEHDLMWRTDRKDLGYVYTCTYEDFKGVVTFLPDLDVEGVLSFSSSVNQIRFSVYVVISSIVLMNFL